MQQHSRYQEQWHNIADQLLSFLEGSVSAPAPQQAPVHQASDASGLEVVNYEDPPSPSTELDAIDVEPVHSEECHASIPRGSSSHSAAADDHHGYREPRLRKSLFKGFNFGPCPDPPELTPEQRELNDRHKAEAKAVLDAYVARFGELTSEDKINFKKYHNRMMDSRNEHFSRREAAIDSLDFMLKLRRKIRNHNAPCPSHREAFQKLKEDGIDMSRVWVCSFTMRSLFFTVCLPLLFVLHLLGR